MMTKKRKAAIAAYVSAYYAAANHVTVRELIDIIINTVQMDRKRLYIMLARMNYKWYPKRGRWELKR